MMTDPIADMLARIRNAAMARHDVTRVPASKIKNPAPGRPYPRAGTRGGVFRWGGAGLAGPFGSKEIVAHNPRGCKREGWYI